MAEKAGPPEPKRSEQPLPDITPPTEQVNILAARLRISEERYSETRKKLLLLEQNMLTNHKRALQEIKGLQDEFSELKRTVSAVEDRIITVIKELRLTARKEDIDVMRKYLELWNPATFARIDTVEKIIDEKLGKHTDEEHEEHDELAARHTYDSPS
ncbi:hypothetical protein C4580_05880 [Candidatus Woesearchaeota archaeon]|nr:MAG: hypothetical protein C4580_05880 [Candidatus Woesearchaeota archaeon]